MIHYESRFREAWEVMRGRLFGPFVFSKWLGLGLTAWLASMLTGGPGFSFTVPSGSSSEETTGSWLPDWGLEVWLAVGLGAFLALAVVVLAMMWLGCRGQLMFLDNVVRNRAAVREPWGEFRRVGNDFFKVYIWIVSIPMVAILLLILVAMLWFWPALLERRTPGVWEFVPWVVALLVLMLMAVAWSVMMFFYREFGIPILFATGCTAREAAWEVWGLLRGRTGDCALYLLVRIGMGMAFWMLACAVGLLTCCVGFLPYVSSVVTLPLAVFRQAFVLGCLSELKPELRFFETAG